MALLHFEGFEALDVAALRKKYPTSVGSPAGQGITALGGGRNGGRAMQAQSFSNAEIKIHIAAAPTTIIVGAAYYVPTQSFVRQLLAFHDVATTSTTQQCHLDVDGSTRAIKLFSSTSSSAVIATSSDFVFPMDEWAYVEVKLTVGNTGSIEVKINGAPVINSSGIDTMASANARCNLLSVWAPATSGKVDDVYVCSTSGSSNNDFLGDMRVDLLQPTADGAYAQFTPSTGTAHYATVDEDPMATADYNSSSTVGHRDSYVMSNLTPIFGSNIKGVYVGILASKTDSGYGTLKPSIRTGGANYDGSAIPLSNSGIHSGTLYETNPATSAAWTESDVNGIEAGVVVA